MSHRNRATTSETESRVKERLSKYPLAEPCPKCGKFRYVTRKAARRARKRTSPGESMSVYRCGPYWHIGHTPWQIRSGLRARTNTVTTYDPTDKGATHDAQQ